MFTKTLGKTAAAVGACAVLGSVASTGVNSRWYRALDKPAIQPPAAVFPVVWTLLYTDIAVSSAVAVDRLRLGDPTAADAYWRALALNLVLNASWSWVFFRAHRIVPAMAVAGALATSSVDLVRRARQAEPAAGAALVPYAAWCGFATVLTGAIWSRNRPAPLTRGPHAG